MHRLLAIPLTCIAVITLTLSSFAAVRRCKTDPIVTLNDSVVQVYVAVQPQHVEYVNGPINVKFTIPDGVAHEVIFVDEGFNGHGETVSFVVSDKEEEHRIAADGTMKTAIEVSLALMKGAGAPKKIPMQVTVVTEDKSKLIDEGWNNRIRVKVDVPPHSSVPVSERSH